MNEHQELLPKLSARQARKYDTYKDRGAYLKASDKTYNGVSVVLCGVLMPFGK